MTFKAGIAGFGLSGQVFHSPHLAAAGIELAAVSSSNAERVHAKFPDAKVYPTPQALFADDSLDLVILATPTPTHGPLAIEALQAGRNVVTDKPFATSLAEADAMIAAAEAAGKVLTCYQNRRWDSEFLTLKQLMAEDKLGDIHEYQGHFQFFRPLTGDWRDTPAPGTGVHFDLGAHSIDQALHLFGTPDWVDGEVLIQRPGGTVADAYVCRMAFGTVRATLTGSLFWHDTRPKLLVQGSKGAYRKDHLDVQEERLRDGWTSTDPQLGVEPEDRWGTLTVSTPGQEDRADITPVPTLPGQHFQFYKTLREAMEAGKEPPVTMQQARLTSAVIEALERASATGQRQVLG